MFEFGCTVAGREPNTLNSDIIAYLDVTRDRPSYLVIMEIPNRILFQGQMRSYNDGGYPIVYATFTKLIEYSCSELILDAGPEVREVFRSVRWEYGYQHIKIKRIGL